MVPNLFVFIFPRSLSGEVVGYCHRKIRAPFNIGQESKTESRKKSRYFARCPRHTVHFSGYEQLKKMALHPITGEISLGEQLIDFSGNFAQNILAITHGQEFWPQVKDAEKNLYKGIRRIGV
jgi:hypothetical protein